MRKVIAVIFLALVVFFTAREAAYAWGFFAHKRINRMAVFTLPPSMIGFYKKHIEYITEHAVDPDKRRYSDEEEACRHYIDLDHYGAHPFDSVPKWWKNAVAKYSEDTLKAYGIVPWHIEKMMYRLTEAFKEQNLDRILYLSADLGHYVGDAHVPLHTTENYNGQLTGQRGIHGFWESRLPELKASDYDYFTGRAKYIEKPIDAAWEAVKGSFTAKDSVLLLEAELNKKFPVDRKYAYEQRGNTTVKVYSAEYSEAYNTMLNGMVERRMRASIEMVGSLWYTAWVDAGQPDLIKLEDKSVSDSLKAKLKADDEMWKNGKIKNPKGHED
jgi:hypothetical protein